MLEDEVAAIPLYPASCCLLTSVVFHRQMDRKGDFQLLCVCSCLFSPSGSRCIKVAQVPFTVRGYSS